MDMEGYLRKIKEASDNQNLIVFIGSGFSKTHASEYKIWSELANELYEDLRNFGYKEDLKNDPLKIAQLYKDRYGQIELKEKLFDLLPKRDVPGELHSFLVKLKPHYIFTTNWDTLLEKAFDKEGLNYDLIVMDDDCLNRERTNNHIVKIHGDLLHNNFVFTHDDYEKYDLLFPKIKTKVTTLLMNHTVLFLGYSFNDPDIQQIFGWIKNNSIDVSSSYMLVFKEFYDKANEDFLEKYRIKTVVIGGDSGIQGENPLESHINFFKSVLSPVVQHNNSISAVRPSTSILKKIEDLGDSSVVLKKTIQERLTNCGFEYDSNSRAYLVFYNKIQTFDYNLEVRQLHQRFLGELIEYENNKSSNSDIPKINEILKKADIFGIVKSGEFPSEDKVVFDFFNNQNEEKKALDYSILKFDFQINGIADNNESETLKIIQKLFNSEKYEIAYRKNLALFSSTKKAKTKLISAFNHNIILRCLKYSFFPHSENYENEKMISIEAEYKKLTKTEQERNIELFEVLSFSFLYKRFYTVQIDLDEILRKIDIIQNGGFSCTNEGPKYFSDHKNLIDYVLGNSILIEPYSEFTNICKKYVEISLLRQFQLSNVVLNIYELFSCIKYYKTEELRKLFKDFLRKDNTKNLNIDLEEKTWLIDSLVSCISLYETKESFSGIERYIDNLIFVLSISKLNEKEIRKILYYFSRLLLISKCTIPIFQGMNSFLGLQYNFHRVSFPCVEIVQLLYQVIEKIINGQCNGYEFIAISRNYLSNIFGICQIENYQYENVIQLNSFLDIVSKFNKKDKHELFSYFLANLYEISGDECKTILEESLEKHLNDLQEEELCIQVDYKLLLVQFDIISITEDIRSDLLLCIQKMKSTSGFSSFWYQIYNRVKWLRKNRNILCNELEDLEKIIERENDFRIESNL